MTGQAVRLLTLDLDNTLWETDPVIIRAEKACHDWIVHNVPQAADFYSLEAIREYRNQIAACYPDLRFRVSKLREEVLRRVFMQSGIDRDQAALLAAEAFAVFYRARSEVTLFDGALEALTQLAGDYPLIALTNGNANLEQIGIRSLFRAHFSAEDIGAPKPQPDLFYQALAEAGVEAGECIHIGDHQEQDVAAAARLGFRTVWVNLADAAWAEPSCVPDQEITHLSQLPAAVAALSRR
ncbi:HAD family hydrolase [Thalassolituus sp. LLYu03]|uniref:HAD family hydrolase n=1 Tax=Thalassolituus sp. LLYu03 TaxID=3421656 RepID=UPI003D2AE833